MPIFEFKCFECGTVFESMIFTAQEAALSCPGCGSTNLKKLFSAFATTGNKTPSGRLTCCGREERCDSPPCDTGGNCRRA